MLSVSIGPRLLVAIVVTVLAGTTRVLSEPESLVITGEVGSVTCAVLLIAITIGIDTVWVLDVDVIVLGLGG